MVAVAVGAAGREELDWGVAGQAAWERVAGAPAAAATGVAGTAQAAGAKAAVAMRVEQSNPGLTSRRCSCSSSILLTKTAATGGGL